MFRRLVDECYSHCQVCHEKREEGGDLLVLPCIHVVCTVCVIGANRRANRATALPKRSQPTKYHDVRRFVCPVCYWPQYRPQGQGMGTNHM